MRKVGPIYHIIVLRRSKAVKVQAAIIEQQTEQWCSSAGGPGRLMTEGLKKARMTRRGGRPHKWRDGTSKAQRERPRTTKKAWEKKE